MKLNLYKLRNTLRTTLIDIWEYVIPIWKISGLFKRIKSKKDLENFIQERSAHVAQTTLYGYLKTRIGVKYIAMMEDEVFLKSINIAKWNIYVVALADCAFYVFSYLMSEKNLKENDCKEIFLKIIENEKKNGNPKQTPHAFQLLTLSLSELSLLFRLLLKKKKFVKTTTDF